MSVDDDYMSNRDTARYLRKWVAEDRISGHGVFAWPTDGCGYDQHIRFVKHRNANRYKHSDQESYREFVLAWADHIENLPD